MRNNKTYSAAERKVIKSRVIGASCLLIMLISFIGCAIQSDKRQHSCTWEECDHRGKTDFVSNWGQRRL